jgi:RimJ/RimL family protein N-acetyltransferase
MHNFNFESDNILEDEIVLMRPLQQEDIEYLLPFSIHEPEIWKYSLVQGSGGREKLKAYIDQAVQARKEKKEYPFIVFDKRTKEYAGSTRFYDIQLSNRSLQLGYTWYGKNFQGTGLNTHCKFLLLQFAFEEMNIERIEFRANNLNERSKAAMKKIGCTIEGVFRNHLLQPDGTRRDSILLSILKEEWISGIKENLRKQL